MNQQSTPSPSSFKQRLFRTRPEDELPLKIEHQRIYILPTRRGWAFLFVLLILLIAAINYSLSLGYALCFLLTGLFAAALLHTYRNLAGLELTSIDTGSAFCGDMLDFNLLLRNHSKFDRFGVRITASIDNTDAGKTPKGKTKKGKTKNKQQRVIIRTSPVNLDIKGHDSASVTMALPTTQRGVIALGRLTLQSDFPLGLWTTWSYVHSSVTAVVYPKAEINPPPLPVDAKGADGNASQSGTQGDVSGLRDYQSGDALTTVAWKTAARGQGLFVRTFDEPVGRSDTHLSLDATVESALEAQLSRLTAWVLQAKSTNTAYALELPGTLLSLNQGAVHDRDALTALALYRGKP